MPFVRILLPFLLGLIFYLTIKSTNHLTLIFLFPILLLIYFFLNKYNYKKIKLTPVLTILIVFLFGINVNYLSDPKNHKDHYLNIKDKGEKVFQGEIISVQYKAKSIELFIELNHCEFNKKKTKGRIIAYSLDTTKTYQPGHQIVFQSTWIKPNSPNNPLAFNYRSYLNNKGIYNQIILNPSNHFLVGQNHSWRIKLDNFRADLVQILRQNLQQEGQFDIAAAMVLGYRNEMDFEIRKQFIHSGLMHILAVSGLHIGIIYSLVFLLLKRIRSSKTWAVLLKTLAILMAIWAFVLLAGAPPSAVRAGFIFSIIQLGKLLRRDAPIYNSLAAAAFCLLVFNPNWIKDIGFQLSFLAVYGIIYFQPSIQSILSLPGKLFHYCWEITSVSLAAQLTTTPISLFYFHQFPIYFWLSGLFGLPLAPVILTSGVLFIILEYLNFSIAFIFLFILKKSVALLQRGTELISNLPGVHFGLEIQFNQEDLFFFYFSIFILILFKETRNKKWLFFFLLIYSINTLFKINIDDRSQQLITFYSLKQSTAIDLFTHENGVSISDRNSEHNLHFAASNWRIANGLKSSEINHLELDTSYRADWLFIHGRQIQARHFRISIDEISGSVAGSTIVYIKSRTAIPVSNRPDLQPDLIVLDPNLGAATATLWESWANQREIPLINMYFSGAVWIYIQEKYLIINTSGYRIMLENTPK